MSDKDYALKAFERLKEAREKISAAAAEGRAATEDERKEAETAYNEAKASAESVKLTEGMDELLAKAATPDRPKVQTGETKTEEPRETRSTGRQFVESKQFQANHEESGEVEIKTLVDSSGGSAGPLLQPEVRPGILPLRYQRLTIADLMPAQSTEATTIRYLVESTHTNNAAPTAEGATKPESVSVFTSVDEAVRKIAVTIPVTDEMLEDVDALAAYLDVVLRNDISRTEENQLLNGSGTPPALRGLLNRSGIQTQARGTDQHAVAIHKAMTKVRTGTAFAEPNGLVMNPTDYETVRLATNANGDFYGGGYFGSPEELQPVWGLRTIVTAAIAQGTALLGDFAGATTVFRKSGITVESTNSHGTFFVEDKTMLRAEERLALAVYRPTAFCTVTGL